MISDDISSKISDIRQCLSTQPVDKAWLFGSCSRGTDGTDSDVDILVSYTKGSTISLLTISRLACKLGKLLNRRVDIVEDGCLLPFAQESADSDKILIYERESKG